MLLVLKFLLPPLLVAVMSVVSRRWGPTVGGLLMGLPWMTGPVLFFLVLERGTAYGVEACVGVEIGIISICAYLLAYSRTTAVLPWPGCLAAAFAAFAASTAVCRGFDLTLLQASLLAAACLLVTYQLLARPSGPAPLAALPWWDIPARMLATLGLVSVISFSADLMGPRLSGIVSTFPVIVTVVGAFTHHQWGADAVRHMLRGLTLSLLAFVAYFYAAGLSMPSVGLGWSYVFGVCAALPVSALLLVANRLRGASR